jgi:hypothetical protein
MALLQNLIRRDGHTRPRFIIIAVAIIIAIAIIIGPRSPGRR